MKTKWAAILAALAVLGTAAGAQQAAQLEPGVARVSLIHGDVSMQRGDSGDWVAVTLNTPVVAGDRVAAAADSRAELQLDWADILRLDANSSAKVAELTANRIQVQVGQGLASYDILSGADAYAEIDTPNISVHPLQHGSYRIEVDSDSLTKVIVRSGKAEIITPQGSTNVESGQMITVEGATTPQYQTAAAPGRDDWDRFNSQRDSLIYDAEAWRHTNHYYTGAGDLDAYGVWQNAPGYGPVWVPAEGPGWVPYRTGRWVWEPYYGWTWVSYEPWGWAPYHYGRWFLFDDSWCWWPGPGFGFRPLWAPAYVSFFGFHFGGGNRFFLGFGSVGWLPIGPGDGFFPWYGGRVNVVNVTNITNITNITNVNNPGVQRISPLLKGGMSNVRQVTINPRLLGAVSNVSAERFGKGGALGRMQPVSAEDFRQGSRFTGHVPVVPTSESLRTIDRTAKPPALRADNNHFFTRNQPPAPKPFSAQAERIQQVIERSPRAQPPAIRQTQAAGAGSKPMTPVTTGRTFEPKPQTARTAGPAATGRSAEPAAGSSRGTGWHSFGPAQGTRPGAGVPGAGVMERGGNRGTVTPQGRGQAGAPNRSYGDSGSMRVPANNNRGQGWHAFSPSSGQVQPETQRGVTPSERGGAPTTERGTPASGERPGWQQFKPQPERGPQGAEQPGRPQVSESRGAETRSYGSPGNERPPLDLRQPIVTPRSGNGGNNEGRSAGYGGASSRSSYGGGASYGGGSRSGGGERPSGYSGGGRSSGGGGHSSGGSSGGRGSSSSQSGGGRPH